jgi:two-component system sensor histidine kinase/response regulator
VLGVVVTAVNARNRQALASASRSCRPSRSSACAPRRLLQAIADGSTDAIFAKDLQGRYLVCNREARACWAAARCRSSATTTGRCSRPTKPRG